MSEHPVGERPEIASVVRRVDARERAIQRVREVCDLYKFSRPCRRILAILDEEGV